MKSQKAFGVLLLIPGEPEGQGCFPRVFIFEQAFYSIFQHRRQQIVFGERPENLAQAGTIDQRILEKHQTYLRRLENFPLKKAAYYRQIQESTGINSVRGLSEITGEDWSYIARVLKVLELPVPIQDFLNAHREPATVKHFNLRRLLEIVRAGNEGFQYARFREALEEIGPSIAELYSTTPQSMILSCPNALIGHPGRRDNALDPRQKISGMTDSESSRFVTFASIS